MTKQLITFICVLIGTVSIASASKLASNLDGGTRLKTKPACSKRVGVQRDAVTKEAEHFLSNSQGAGKNKPSEEAISSPSTESNI